MFTSLLFDHIFDIDDIIRALCADEHSGHYILNSRTGELIESTAPHADTSKKSNDNSHQHAILPLPVSQLDALKHACTHSNLAPEQQTIILEKINNSKTMQQLFNALDDSRESHWLRGRLHNLALAWLDQRNMIPPSMRYIPEVLPHSSTPKVSIVTTNKENK